MKTYQHDFLVYAMFPATFCLAAYYGFESWSNGAQPGAETARQFFIGFVAIWCFITGYLFTNYALVRYYLDDNGLIIKRFWSKSTRAWSELKSLNINRSFKYFVVRDTDNKVVVFASLDYFKDAREFVEAIQLRTDNLEIPSTIAP